MTGLSIAFTGLRKQYNNLRQEILEATDEVLRSGQLMDGNFTAEFENWLAKKNHVQYAVTVHSGTSALECIAEYYATEKGVPNPPRVLIPNLTYSATANAFMRAGWEIHFVDVDSHGVFDTRKIPDVSYQVVVLVGLYGASIAHMGDIRIWREWTLNDKIVVEDAAQHWLASDCTRIGSAAALSFDPMKNLPAYGNGGAVLTNDHRLFHFAQAWKNNGKSDHLFSGTNSRMSELECALMMVKTRHLDQWQQRRQSIARYWLERLAETKIRALVNTENIEEHSLHKFVIEVDHRDDIQQQLHQRKIDTRVHYPRPLHEHGIFRQWPGPDILSVGSALSRRVLSLPIYPELTDLEVEYIVDQVVDCVKTAR